MNPAGSPPNVFSSNTTLNYTELTPAKVIDPGIVLVDSGSTMVTSATISLSGGFSEDVLGFTPSSGIIGTYTASSNTLLLTGSASLTAYQNVLDGVTYQDTSNDPHTSSRTVSFQYTDSLGHSSTIGTDTINVIQINQVPTLTMPASNATSPSVIDDGTLVLGRSASPTSTPTAPSSRSPCKCPTAI